MLRSGRERGFGNVVRKDERNVTRRMWDLEAGGRRPKLRRRKMCMYNLALMVRLSNCWEVLRQDDH